MSRDTAQAIALTVLVALALAALVLLTPSSATH